MGTHEFKEEKRRKKGYTHRHNFKGKPYTPIINKEGKLTYIPSASNITPELAMLSSLTSQDGLQELYRTVPFMSTQPKTDRRKPYQGKTYNSNMKIENCNDFIDNKPMCDLYKPDCVWDSSRKINCYKPEPGSGKGPAKKSDPSAKKPDPSGKDSDQARQPTPAKREKVKVGQ